MKNIIEELDNITPADKYLFLESRANHTIVAVINLLHHIRENFDQSEASDLTRRFLNSIRSEDPRKFTRKIRQIREDNGKGNGFLEENASCGGTSAGNVAGVNSGLGAGDPKASIYYKSSKKKAKMPVIKRNMP